MGDKFFPPLKGVGFLFLILHTAKFIWLRCLILYAKELERLQSKERKQILDKVADVLEKVTREDITDAVRKSRESR